ncbi:MAG: CocE/NonD family hydrolase [Steroidobacteraceae bacterium]|nr:CocE/NonD family hydrolase [Steroidobacteraceae bacterium]
MFGKSASGFSASCAAALWSAALAALAVLVVASAPARAGAAAKPPLVLETRRLPMQDGTRVSVCLAKPPAARRGQRFPVLLTVDGYGGPCGSFGRGWYEDFVRAGYVVAYLHVRGTGESDGTLPATEYSDHEIDDAVETIDWLSRQPWSTGRIGMFGTSWSGFTSMLVAARRPPALRAIVAYMATENIYHEDVRFPDGIFHLDDYSVAADVMLVATPPDRDPFDERLLRQRFDQQPWSLTFLRQQRDGEFWRRSQRRDLDPTAGEVPTLKVGAWHDPYRSAVVRALEHSSGPVHAVIGPWNHSANFPGPTADIGRLSLDWWDHFLKGKRNDVLERPQVYAFMRRPHRPIVTRALIPGEWRAFDRWRDAPVEMRRWSLNVDRSVGPAAGAAGQHRLRMVPSTGVSLGIGWIDVPPDQRLGDSTALLYESAPFAGEVQILGEPVARLSTAIDVNRANWFVKLSDVAPDGTTTLITGGALNGAHRESSVAPTPLEPGRRYELTLPLQFTSWIFQPGHRLRVSVANALFPAYWPSAEPLEMTLEVGEGGSTLTLPVVPPQSAEAAERAAAAVGSRNVTVAEAETAGTGASEYTWNGPVRSQWAKDDIAGTTTFTRGFQWVSPDGEDITVEFTVDDDDPARASFVGRAFLRSEWQGQPVEWRGTTEVRSDPAAFEYRHVRQLLRDGKVVREREWKERVPRDHQ